MSEEVTPERTKLLKGHKWPKDRYGDEIDVGDFLMCVRWYSYPEAVLAKVTRIGKTGKVHVVTTKVHPKDSIHEFEIKECRFATRLSKNMINAMTLDKLASV